MKEHQLYAYMLEQSYKLNNATKILATLYDLIKAKVTRFDMIHKGANS